MFEEVKPLQEKQLTILKELKRVCELNNLTYYIVFGTLLGAVRHKGFIPWDDDIDVCMRYDDYKRLEEICKKDLSSDFFLQTADNDPQSHLTFKRLRLNATTLIHEDFVDCDINHGIPLDVYPLYNLSDNATERKKQIKAAMLYLLLSSGAPPKHHGKFTRFATSMLLKWYSGKRRQKKINKCLQIMTKYNNVQTAEVGMLFGNPARCKKAYSAKIFDGTVQLQFEDDTFSAPQDYDGFLSSEYGDYMQLPPAEQQGCKLEKIVKLDVDTPYTEYKGKLYCVNNKKEGSN